MSSVRLGWFVSGSLLFTLAGCEVTTVDCDEDPDASVCNLEFDGDDGDGEDGDDDAGIDGSTTDEDAQVDGDAGEEGDAGDADAGVDAGPTGEPLTATEFCNALYANAIAFRDAFDTCACPSGELDIRDDFLEYVYDFKDNTLAKCEAWTTNGNITYVDTKAGACAEAYNKQYNGLASGCPAVGTGFDLDGLESTLAHGAADPVQLPACRAALVGKVEQDDPCTDSFECVSGLRCLSAPGGGKTCQVAVKIVPTGGACVVSSDCADGLICAGGTARKCIASNDLLLDGGKCTFSKECTSGSLCELDPVGMTDFICRPLQAGTDDNICM